MSDLIKIPHEGRKPDWLSPEERLVFRFPDGECSVPFPAILAVWLGGEYLVDANHWAAPVLRAGLTPWNPTLQGDGPPKDYAGGKVMFRNGVIGATLDPTTFPWLWRNEDSDIIGYEPAPMTTNEPAPVEQRLADIAQRILRQADCLDHYAEQSGFNCEPLPSVFHLQSRHFRDLAKELLAYRIASTPTAETDEGPRAALLDLLAVIHRDGGHKAQEVGWKLAAEQAMGIAAEAVQRTPSIRAKALEDAAEVADAVIAENRRTMATVATLETLPVFQTRVDTAEKIAAALRSLAGEQSS